MAFTNIGSYNPKNYIINGNMDFWQRVEGNTTTVNSASGNGYTADRMKAVWGGTTTKNFSIVQSSSVPSFAQSGTNSVSSYLSTVITPISSFASGDYVVPLWYIIEGSDYQRIHGKTVTFGFWFQASVSGTYSFVMQNSAASLSYATTFNIAAANTWQYVNITVTLDNAGSWNFTNGSGLLIYVASVAGATFGTSNLNTWQSGNFVAASSATNYFATSSATFNITQFSLTEGPYGLGATGFQRAGVNISEELRMCQRYYNKSFPIGTAPVQNSGNVANAFIYEVKVAGVFNDRYTVPYIVTMRAIPTITYYNPSAANGKWRNIDSSTDSGTASTGAGNGTNGFEIVSGQLSGDGQGAELAVHWSADCDL